MFWTLICEPADPAAWAEASARGGDGRFVLHRHVDAEGPHLDLRLECGDRLVGWRIDATSLEGRPWAVEKAPHPRAWLDRDTEAVHAEAAWRPTREDTGVYAWLDRGPARCTLVLHGTQGDRKVRLERTPALSPAAVRAVCEALARYDIAPESAAPEAVARLIHDGMTARRRAIGRLCGLGHELDGTAFDETVWRKAAEGLTLDELHAQLRAFEVRFDAKYPPAPVSRPERLVDAGTEDLDRAEAAWAILRE